MVLLQQQPVEIKRLKDMNNMLEWCQLPRSPCLPPPNKTQLHIGTENLPSSRVFGSWTMGHLSIRKTEGTWHTASEIALEIPPDATQDHNVEYLDWKTDGSLPKRHFSFEKEGLFQTTSLAVTVIISPPEKHPEYVSVWQALRCSTPGAEARQHRGRGSKATPLQRGSKQHWNYASWYLISGT